MACMSHYCAGCGREWFDNAAASTCPGCGGPGHVATMDERADNDFDELEGMWQHDEGG